jgi:hypothetical protein
MSIDGCNLFNQCLVFFSHPVLYLKEEKKEEIKMKETNTLKHGFSLRDSFRVRRVLFIFRASARCLMSFPPISLSVQKKKKKKKQVKFIVHIERKKK